MKGTLLQCSVISGFVKLEQVEGSCHDTGIYRQAAQKEITGLFAYGLNQRSERATYTHIEIDRDIHSMSEQKGHFMQCVCVCVTRLVRTETLDLLMPLR